MKKLLTINKNRFPLPVVLLFLVFLFSCQSDPIETDPTVLPDSECYSDQEILRMLGFEAEDVIEETDRYVVQGDILLDKSRMNGYLPALPDGQTRQAFSSRYGLISSSKQGNISVYIQSTLNNPGWSEWSTAASDAVAEWNGIQGTKIQIRQTYSIQGADIIIQTGNSFKQPNIVAYAYLPCGGMPGDSVLVNRRYDYYSLSQKKFIMVHELGHALGFLHTNWRTEDPDDPAVTIPGTTDYDPGSVMNGSTGGYSWNGFAENDIKAFQTLYPGMKGIRIEAPSQINPGVLFDAALTYAPLNLTYTQWSATPVSGQGSYQAKMRYTASGARKITAKVILRNAYNQEVSYELTKDIHVNYTNATINGPETCVVGLIYHFSVLWNPGVRLEWFPAGGRVWDENGFSYEITFATPGTYQVGIWLPPEIPGGLYRMVSKTVTVNPVGPGGFNPGDLGQNPGDQQDHPIDGGIP